MTISETFTRPVPVDPHLSMQPRARGAAALRLKCVDGHTRIADLRLSGSSKLLFPRTAVTTAVSLNTSGGVTGGDRFRLRLHLEAQTRAALTTQAAERFYRAQPGQRGLVANKITLGAGARLNWLPQETLIFDGAHGLRASRVEMEETAEFLAVEPLVFGRSAMGETRVAAAFEDRWNIRRGGQLVFADRLTIRGEVADMMARFGASAMAMASLVFVSRRSEACLERLRDTLGPLGAASLIRPGVVFARLLAPDGFDLRCRLIPALTALTGAPLPRTWMI
ncbi:urease accessory protein UreD [Primorskyibacter sp. S187A]|uniref:urease accessory protein UreD n=1 Tax=Primorskyibacter sp. S187A TaxID=3415130 RepID=UPI003C7C7B12